MNKRLHGERGFQTFALAVLIIMTVASLLPVILIVIASFTEENSLIADGYSYFPKKWSLDAYYYMVKQKRLILRAYGVSFFVTVVGTLLSVLLTTTLAYPMSRKNFRFAKIMTFLVFFTMLFRGGVVPSYMMWSQIFHIKNTVWALIVPNYLVLAFNIMLVKNYYQNSIPEALLEAAEIDGASELTVFWKIVFPLSTPVIATISLFTALKYWNDWVNALYFITKPQLYGIQNLLLRIMDNIQFLKSGGASDLAGAAMVELPGTSVRMAMAVIGILPIVLTYPFVQKYFMKGVVVGAVKG
ncbi:MAG: carbohydrate ABC transporter permease [Eubacteriales bacterium]|nr:carbohydrate ABC transporter permease [Eubacteriales bacterium]